MDDSPIGHLGVLAVGTRGDAGPGEVVLSLRGATETFLAWSGVPLPRGTEVVVVDRRGPRTLEVESCEDLGSEAAVPDASLNAPGAQSGDDAPRGELEL